MNYRTILYPVALPLIALCTLSHMSYTSEDDLYSVEHPQHGYEHPSYEPTDPNNVEPMLSSDQDVNWNKKKKKKKSCNKEAAAKKSKKTTLRQAQDDWDTGSPRSEAKMGSGTLVLEDGIVEWVEPKPESKAFKATAKKPATKKSTKIEYTPLSKELLAEHKAALCALYPVQEGQAYSRVGFTICAEDLAVIRKAGSDDTYGEIMYDGLEDLIQKVKPSSLDKFWDLGSGAGSVVLHVAHNSPVAHAYGIELSTDRYNIARKAQEDLETAGYKKAADKVTFLNEDMLNVKLSKVKKGGRHLVFTCSTCFSNNLLHELMNVLSQQMVPGSILLSLKNLPQDYPLYGFSEPVTYQEPMTWMPKETGGSAVYAYTFMGLPTDKESSKKRKAANKLSKETWKAEKEAIVEKLANLANLPVDQEKQELQP